MVIQPFEPSNCSETGTLGSGAPSVPTSRPETCTWAGSVTTAEPALMVTRPPLEAGGRGPPIARWRAAARRRAGALPRGGRRDARGGGADGAGPAAGGWRAGAAHRALAGRGAAAQVGQLRVERAAGALGLVAVAVAGDALQDDLAPGRVAVGLAAGGRDGDLALDRGAVDRELPGDELGHRLQRGLGLAGGVEGADVGHAGGDRVVALRLGADHRLVDAAGAALEDLAVLVDEEVVADVVPAVGVAVVLRDAEDDPGGVLRPVAVRAHRVVDEGHLHVAVARRGARRHGGRAPRGARDHGRRQRGVLRLGRARGRCAVHAPAGGGRDRHEVDAQVAGRACRGDAQLQLVAAAGPDRIRGALAGARVGRVVAVDRQRDPAAPPPSGTADAHLDVAARAAQADEVEALRPQDAAR